MGRGDRPELAAPPDVFYNDAEARKYTTNSRMIEIQVCFGVLTMNTTDKTQAETSNTHPPTHPTHLQAALTERALELLALPSDGRRRLLLDLGCGSGLSGDALAAAGHAWAGLDIAPAMLAVAAARGVDGGDLLLGDMGHGLPLRAGCFDGAVSISAIQWLCNADTAAADPRKRMRSFFEALYRCLTRGARAVLQCYPDGPAQAELLVGAAMRAGFGGGLVVDYPNSTRARKHFLVLTVGGGGGGGAGEPLPAALDGDGDGERAHVAVGGRTGRGGRGGVGAGGGGRHHGVYRPGKGSKAWIVAKKERARAKGQAVPSDSRYTGRKRRPKF